MTTAAPGHDGATTPKELDERTHEAWADYRESLRDLSGRDYDDAEDRSWERLQRRLREVDELRESLAGSTTATR